MGFLNEFKAFALKGNVMDMAVGVIIGGAFGKIVTSLVNDVIMPPIGLIVGGACCFLPFPNAPTWAKFIIFIAGYVVWDAFYTVANVPYGSLLSLISDDVKDRASLSAWRSIGSIFGNMLPMVILPFIIYDSNNNLVGNRVFIAADRKSVV